MKSHLALTSTAILPLSLICSIVYSQQGSDASPSQQVNPYVGEQGVPNSLEQSLGSINDCYRGMHPYFGEDYVGTLISKAGQATWTQLNDICKRSGGGSPSIAIPIGPINVPSDKVCYAIAHKACVPD